MAHDIQKKNKLNKFDDRQIPIKGTKDEIKNAIKLFAESDIARTETGKQIFNTLKKYFLEDRITWEKKGGGAPAAEFIPPTEWEFTLGQYEKKLVSYGKGISCNFSKNFGTPLLGQIITLKHHSRCTAAWY